VFPVLLEIPNAWTMPFGALFAEIAIGVGCALGWLALHLRKRHETVASLLNTVAVLVLLHLVLSRFMKTEAGYPPITIYSFGVVIILGFLAGARYMVGVTDKLGLERKKVFDWAFWMLVVGVVGSRLLYAFLKYEEFSANKFEVLRIWNGGLVWYGGLVPAAIVGVWLLSRWKMPVLHVCDIGAAAVMLALGVGRWACLLAGDDYGQRTDGFWGIRFHDERALIPQELRGRLLEPTQLYMSVMCLWLFYFVDRVRRHARFAGKAFAVMIIAYAVCRGVLIEPIRGDFVERNPGYREHVAAELGVLDPDGDAPPLERGDVVEGTIERQGREKSVRGHVLNNLELDNEGYGTVYVLSDGEVAPAMPRGVLGAQLSRTRGPAPEWNIEKIRPRDGDAFDAEFRTVNTQWYGSHMPQPVGYVSTSQWISGLLVAIGILMLIGFRKLGIPGYTATVAADKAADYAEKTGEPGS